MGRLHFLGLDRIADSAASGLPCDELTLKVRIRPHWGRATHGVPGKSDRERRAVARLRAKRQGSGELLEDLPAHEQAQAGSVRLGGEEWLKEPAAIGDRDAA